MGYRIEPAWAVVNPGGVTVAHYRDKAVAAAVAHNLTEVRRARLTEEHPRLVLVPLPDDPYVGTCELCGEEFHARSPSARFCQSEICTRERARLRKQAQMARQKAAGG